MHIEFIRPVFLYIAGALAMCGALLAWHHFRRRKKFREFFRTTVFQPKGDARLMIVGYACGTIALALFALALALPVRDGQENTQGFRGVIVFDVSLSMKASDVRPSRSAAAGYTLKKFFEVFPRGEASLVIFGKEPFVASETTTDMSEIVWLVTKWLMPDSDATPVSGSDLAASVIAAAKLPLAKDGVIVLISDGADQSSGEMMSAIAEARKVHARVITIGVGTEEGASVKVDEGESGWTRLEESGMRTLAEATGGVYRRYRTGNELVEAFYTHQNFLRPVTVNAKKNCSWIPFGAALLFAFGWALVTYRK